MKNKLEYPIISPKFLGERNIGFTLADKPHKMVGRNLTVYGRQVDKNLPKHYFKFTFKISGIDGETLKADFIGHEVSRAYISRHVHTGSTRIDSFVKGVSEDGQVVILKPIIVTPTNICTSIVSKLRKELSKFLRLYIQNNDVETITKEIMSDELQGYLKKSLNAIYPINILEIRKSEVKPLKKEE
jgi:ribosomal protein S3AE